MEGGRGVCGLTRPQEFPPGDMSPEGALEADGSLFSVFLEFLLSPGCLSPLPLPLNCNSCRLLTTSLRGEHLGFASTGGRGDGFRLNTDACTHTHTHTQVLLLCQPLGMLPGHLLLLMPLSQGDQLRDHALFSHLLLRQLPTHVLKFCPIGQTSDTTL